MSQAAKTVVTLAVLVVLLGVAAAWGWSSLTKPLPGLADAPVCVETPVGAGDTVTPEQVTVSVLNAGKRSGLAGQTMTDLVDQGFTEGDRGNAPATMPVGNVQIWTDDPDSPAVALVATRLKKVRVVQRDVDQVGVVIVVGDKFRGVGKGRPSVTATKPTTICSPES
jgi:hypothetical protein